MTLKPGDRIVARWLPLKRGSRDTLPAVVAIVCEVLAGELVISLRVGGDVARFARKPRRCDPGNVARLATDREVATGYISGPLPAVEPVPAI